ncbi:DNA-3-methyladenine glycosylase 1 [Planctomycetes bacterium Pla163]|uniref:DNA-3-methyladenine glycosylase 1 n=1 Tax=Rohdeia mirabilis TaxID=2528008 RepID=A0A518CX54_9BACT|nr:DNA-3-methyladenine glycosylase 1 [Planctomycetes bacterium Pla163]
MSAAPAGSAVVGADGLARCGWCGEDPEYVRYHDEEWGRPVTEDARLFEKLCLEAFQSGLSWLTILRKRPAFRTAFAGFESRAVAAFGPADVERLLGDVGIVRHRGKIEAAIHNAARVLEVVDELGSLARLAWRFDARFDEHGRPRPFTGLHATTDESKAFARELKRRGFVYLGPTTLYAFMQAMGLVNDHVPGCVHRAVCDEARERTLLPSRGD